MNKNVIYNHVELVFKGLLEVTECVDIHDRCFLSEAGHCFDLGQCPATLTRRVLLESRKARENVYINLIYLNSFIIYCT